MNSRAIIKEESVISTPEIAAQNVRTEKEVSDHGALSASFRNEETEVQKG